MWRISDMWRILDFLLYVACEARTELYEPGIKCSFVNPTEYQWKRNAKNL